MEYRNTSSQTARGTRPDGSFGSTLYLVKRVSLLRLTYQIRLLTMMAATQRGRLVIQIPKGARASRDLRAFIKEHSKDVRLERVG